MKKTLLLIVVLLMMFFCLEITQFAKAAPQLPSEPDKSEPAITIHEPIQNQSYFSAVHYSVTVKKPSSWFSYNPIHGEIMLIKYKLDSNEEIEIADLPGYYSSQPLTYKGDLTNLPEGAHTFQIRVHSCSYYNSQYDESNPMSWGVEQFYYIDTYSNVTFTVQTEAPITPAPSPSPEPTQSPEPQPEPLPTLPVALAIVAAVVVVVGLLVYFKKHKREGKA